MVLKENRIGIIDFVLKLDSFWRNAGPPLRFEIALSVDFAVYS